MQRPPTRGLFLLARILVTFEATMNNTEIASFVWYLAFLLVPIIPAIIIYKMFPATQVGANGVLGNLKINATGAFAAYLITAMLGFLYVQFKEKRRNDIGQYKTYEVSSRLAFRDKNGKIISGGLLDSLTRKTSISLHPGNIVYQKNGIIKYLVTGRDLDEIIVNYSYPGFTNFTMPLTDLAASKVNEGRGTINLDTIYLDEEVLYYMSAMDTTAVHVEELGSGEGPPIIQ